MTFIHHAYVYEGSLTHASALEAFVRGLEPRAAIDISVYERFGIDEARQLRLRSALKSAGRTVYIVVAAALTTEAQQALLKLFEEPQPDLSFILAVPHGTLLPTLRSRCLPLPGFAEGHPASGGEDARAFLKESHRERSARVAALLAEESGARERVREFVNDLERLLYAGSAKATNSSDIRAGLDDIAHLRGYLADRSVSLKMILEHLAASLPML